LFGNERHNIGAANTCAGPGSGFGAFGSEKVGGINPGLAACVARWDSPGWQWLILEGAIFLLAGGNSRRTTAAGAVVIGLWPGEAGPGQT